MANIGKMAGTSWHTGVVSLQEGEEKRHRSRCAHYDGKQTDRCIYYVEKCHGSSHCNQYQEKTANYEADNYSIVKQKYKNAIPFEGIKELNILEIMVNKAFSSNLPKQKKVDDKVAYYKANSRFDKPIVVECQNGRYWIQDGYSRLLAAKKLRLTTIPAEMGSEEFIQALNDIRKVGCLVWHKKHGEVGLVIQASFSKVTVRFDDGHESTYDIHKALKSETIRVL